MNTSNAARTVSLNRIALLLLRRCREGRLAGTLQSRAAHGNDLTPQQSPDAFADASREPPSIAVERQQTLFEPGPSLQWHEAVEAEHDVGHTQQHPPVSAAMDVDERLLSAQRVGERHRAPAAGRKILGESFETRDV